jgi:hypothetical protein
MASVTALGLCILAFPIVAYAAVLIALFACVKALSDAF